MIRGTPIEHAGTLADKIAHQAAIETGVQFMGMLHRPDLIETGQPDMSHCIAIAYDDRVSAGGMSDRQELTSVEHLAMRQMDIGKGDAIKIDHLRQAWRYPQRKG